VKPFATKKTDPGARKGLGAAARKRVAAATVRVGDGGQGVLVPGGLVLTAAHCISWSGTGRMALGEHFVESVRTKSGASFRLGPIAVEPVADIAVLAGLDNQVFFDDADAFEAWHEGTDPLPLSAGFERWCGAGKDGVLQKFNVHVLTHTGKWVDGHASRVFVSWWKPGATVGINMRQPIRGGTSGGPVVDDAGALVGVVSFSSEVKRGPCEGGVPYAAQALPRWVLDRIQGADDE
jgi:hypothetical protein